MKIFYALALSLLLATTAQAQSHTNPVGEKSIEDEIRKNERWRTFYDSLTPAEKNQFMTWWRANLSARKEVDPVDTNNPEQLKREFRSGMQRWYRDEVPTFEQKREMQMRYDELWAERQRQKSTATERPLPKKKTTINVIDVRGDPTRRSTGGSRYYTR